MRGSRPLVIWCGVGEVVSRFLEGENECERTQDDHTGRPISALLVLCPAQLDHVFCGRVSDVDLSKNRISIICEAGEQDNF